MKKKIISEEFKRMQKIAGVLNENTKGLSLLEAEKILNNILEEYLDGLGENTGQDGIIDFGYNVGYKTKAELLDDFAGWVGTFK